MKKDILKLAKTLMKKGYKDVLFLDRGQAQKVLTEKRIELIKTIEDKEIRSIRDLARKVERKPSNVHEGLMLLAEYGIVEFEEKGRSKVPKVKPSNIFIKPIKLKDNIPMAKTKA